MSNTMKTESKTEKHYAACDICDAPDVLVTIIDGGFVCRSCAANHAEAVAS